MQPNIRPAITPTSEFWRKSSLMHVNRYMSIPRSRGAKNNRKIGFMFVVILRLIVLPSVRTRPHIARPAIVYVGL